MNTPSKVQTIQQSYKLATLAHMLAKAYQVIYQNNLYSLVSNVEQSGLATEYEAKVVDSLAEISMSISDMSSCMLHRNPEGFDKIYSQINQEAVTVVSMFNEINEAARKHVSSKSHGDEDSDDNREEV